MRKVYNHLIFYPFYMHPFRVIFLFGSMMLATFNQLVLAQNRDAQLWENINLETNLSRNWYIHLNHEGRITDNITYLNYAYLDAGITRKFNKNWRLTIDYVFVDKFVKEEFWSKRHQFYTALSYKKKIGKLLFYDRQMFQLQVKDIFCSTDGRKPDYYLRNKITVKYKNRSRLTPYFAEEVYLHLNNNPTSNQLISDRARFFAGCFYALNTIDEFELYYLMERHYNTNNPPQNYIVGVGFSHSFY